MVGALALYGCAQHPMIAPSGAGVQSGLGRVGTNVSSARRYNDLAVIHNSNAMTKVQRIEAKAQILQRYWGK